MKDYEIRNGYIRVCGLNGKVEDEYRYDDLMLNPLLRETVASRSSMLRRVSCCCRSDDAAVVRFDSEGRLIDTDYSEHSDECSEHLKELEAAFGGTYLRALAEIDVPMPVDFDLRPETKKDISVLDHDAAKKIFAYGTAATMKQFLVSLNMKTFRGTRKNFFSLRNEPVTQAAEFMDSVSGVSVSMSDGTIHRLQESDLYSEADTKAGECGICYGKIEWINKEQLPEKDNPEEKYYSTAWISVRDHYGHKMTLTVNRKDFRHKYYQLSDRENAWIFGKVTHQLQERLDPSMKKKGAPVMSKIKPVFVKTDADLVDVSVCRQYVLFCCNDCGMIVFDGNEMRKSNELISAGKRLERPFTCSGSAIPLIVNTGNSEEKVV